MKTLSRALFLVLWSSLPLSAAVFPAAPADWLRANGGARAAAQSATQTPLRGTDLAATRNATGVAGQGAGNSARPAWLFANVALGAPQPATPAELIPAGEPQQWLIDLGPELAQIIDMIDISFGGGSGANPVAGAVTPIATDFGLFPPANAPLAPVPLPPSAGLFLAALGLLAVLRRAKPLHLPPQREILPA